MKWLALTVGIVLLALVAAAHWLSGMESDRERISEHGTRESPNDPARAPTRVMSGGVDDLAPAALPTSAPETPTENSNRAIASDVPLPGSASSEFAHSNSPQPKSAQPNSTQRSSLCRPAPAPGTVGARLNAEFKYDPGEPDNVELSKGLPALDKTECLAASRALREARHMFHVTDTQAIWYSFGTATPATVEPRNHMNILYSTLLAHMCEGNQPFASSYQPQFELIAVGPAGHTRLWVGEHWVSDGTVFSLIPTPEYSYLAEIVVGRTRAPGQTMARENFDKLARDNFAAIIEKSATADRLAAATKVPGCP